MSSHFGASAKLLKTGLVGAALALGLSIAGAADAAQVFLQTTSMNTSRTAHIYGPQGSGYHAYTYIAPIQFHAFEGTEAIGPAFDFVAFCVDIFHGISLGTVNLRYDDAYELTTNSKYLTTSPFVGGTALTNGQQTQVGRLVNYGAVLFQQGPNTAVTVDKLAGLQGAIWQVVNPGYSVVGSAGVNTWTERYTGGDYQSWIADLGPVPGAIDFITETGRYGTSSAHQSFAMVERFGPSQSAAPEPAVWISLIAGFGLMGAMLRRNRTAGATV